MRPAFLFVLVCLAMAAFARAGEDQAEVKPGSALRRELFDLARPAVEKMAGRPVLFQGSLKREGPWAAFVGQIVDESGAPIPVGPGESADTVAVWRQKGNTWKLVAAHAGHTDVIYLDWPEKYGVPRMLLGL